MSTLHDDLSSLTSTQPEQPPGRLIAVTRKAGRVRRNRAAVSIAAVIALAVPVGAVLTGSTTHQAVPTTSSDSWPDRSQQADRDRAGGAVAQRHLLNPDEPTGTVHWLYRGTVSVPDGSKPYVAIWREAGKLVRAYVDPSQVDAHGIPTEGFNYGGEGHTNTPWLVFSVVDRNVPAVGLFLPYDQSLPDNKGAVLVLTDPRTRTLHWDVTPLRFAPTGNGGRLDTGELAGQTGVFFGDTGATVGPLSVTTSDGTPLLSAEPLALPNQDLLRPDLSDLPPGVTFHEGAAGAFERGNDAASLSYATGPLAHVSMFVRCYGAGSIVAHLGYPGTVVGRAACDGQLHRVFHNRALTAAHTLTLDGSGPQVWRFALV